MSFFPIPSEQEILKQVLDDLQRKLGPEFANSPGTVARAIVEAFNKQLSSVYYIFESSLSSRFLSTAVGNEIDMLASLVGCTREPLESDNNYKSRINKHVYSAANTNINAIRSAALSVAGVKNILIEEYGAGAGSFILYIITDEIFPSYSIISEVQSKVEQVKAEGIRSIIKTPDLMSIKFKIRASRNNSTLTKLGFIKLVETYLTNFINEISIASIIPIDTIITGLSNVNTNVDIIFEDLLINNKSINPSNTFQLGQYERTYFDSIEVIWND